MKMAVNFEPLTKASVFWMTLTDFTGAFGQLAIGLSEDSWMVSRRELALSKPKHSIKFNNPVD